MDIDRLGLTENPFNLADTQVDWVRRTFDALTPDEKIGQLLHTVGSGVSRAEINRIVRLGISGVHMFAGFPAFLLRRYLGKLQSRSSIPMLVSADLEYGLMLIPRGGSEFPMSLGVAATDDPAYAERMGRVAAREAGALGFNWGLTPVIDIDYEFRSTIVNNRSFGSDPARIRAMASAYIRGMQDEGMGTSIKHWPGDGIDDRDQHTVVSINNMDMETWRATYGRNYRELIDGGALTVMSAHITLPAYYRERRPDCHPLDMLPASVSKDLNQDLLRGELGFNGLIVSDATTMGGYNDAGPRETTLPTSVENGIDLILFSRNDDEDIEILKQGIRTGILSQARVDEAVLRVLALKAALRLHERKERGNLVPPRQVARKTIGADEHKKWALEAVEKSITLVKDTQEILPISPRKHRRVLLIEGKLKTPFGSKRDMGFRKALEREGFEVHRHDKINGTIRRGRFDLVIYATGEGIDLVNPTRKLNWHRLQKRKGNPLTMMMNMELQMAPMARYWHEIPTIYVSMGTPYRLFEVPYCKTMVNAYACTSYTNQAVIDRLVGRKPFTGVSPVDPFCGIEAARY